MPLQDTIANLEAAGFNNPSIGGIYKKEAEALQLSVDTVSQEIDNTYKGVTDLITNKAYGKGGYYVDSAKAFQYGDNLSIDTLGNFYYPTIDTTKQIVKQAAYEWDKVNNYQALKVATQDINGNTVALNTAQLAAFRAYMSNFILAGIPLNIISLSPNVILYTAQLVYYSTYDLPTLQTNFAAAQKAFQNNFVYNGVFYENDFSEYIKANVPGVRDFYLITSQVDGVPFSGKVYLQAGTFSISVASSVTYQPV